MTLPLENGDRNTSGWDSGVEFGCIAVLGSTEEPIKILIPSRIPGIVV